MSQSVVCRTDNMCEWCSDKTDVPPPVLTLILCILINNILITLIDSL